VSGKGDGSQRRFTGRLGKAERGPILELADGTVWRLITDDDLAALVGEQVVVEGRSIGFDGLELIWIGRAPDNNI
jgi:membrane protein implicated in regulation of membrane protease activity